MHIKIIFVKKLLLHRFRSQKKDSKILNSMVDQNLEKQLLFKILCNNFYFTENIHICRKQRQFEKKPKKPLFMSKKGIFLKFISINFHILHLIKEDPISLKKPRKTVNTHV